MYKTKLQELCHQKRWSLPEYTSIREGPDHSPSFQATVVVNGLVFPTETRAKSSKQAQNDAAKLAFEHFALPSQPPPPQIQQDEQSPCISSFPQPTFPTSFGQPSIPSASGPSRESADMYVTPATLQAQPQSKDNDQCPLVNTMANDIKDVGVSRDMKHLYKNQLQSYAQKNNLTLPLYTSEHMGPPHAYRFKCKVTIAGQTYESLEFFSTLKDAEHAAAKVALTALQQDRPEEDKSSLYKNLLQEVAQKEGFLLPIYTTARSGQSHAPMFISTVEIEGEGFTGLGSKTKKLAEMSAAKIAYNTLKERKSSGGPLIVTPGNERQEAPQLSSCSVQSNMTNNLFQHTKPKALTISNPSITAEKQATENKGKIVGVEMSKELSERREVGRADGSEKRQRTEETSAMVENASSPTIGPSSSNSDALRGRNLGPTSPDIASIYPQIAPPPSPSLISNALPGRSGSSSSSQVMVCSRMLKVKLPEGSTILPMSDDNWVAYSLPNSNVE